MNHDTCLPLHCIAAALQWGIPDFPEGSTNPSEDVNLLFGKIIAENCIKMKEIGPKGTSLVPPLGSTADAFWSYGLNNCVLQMQEDNFSIEVVIGFFNTLQEVQ